MIEQKLREYKSNLSKLHLIECEMQRIENEIQLIDPSYISAVQYSNMPKSVTNKFNSIVENTVIEIENNREQMDRLKTDLWGYAAEIAKIKPKIRYVEALLEGLTEEERFAIEKFYFDGLPWHLVAERYSKEYGIYKTPKTMRGKRNEALQKMERNMISCKSPA
jgi:uncharacterized protein (DUF885 family)